MNLTQMASASVKIIFDTVSGWRQASLFKIFSRDQQGRRRRDRRPRRAFQEDLPLSVRNRPGNMMNSVERDGRSRPGLPPPLLFAPVILVTALLVVWPGWLRTAQAQSWVSEEGSGVRHIRQNIICDRSRAIACKFSRFQRW